MRLSAAGTTPAAPPAVQATVGVRARPRQPTPDRLWALCCRLSVPAAGHPRVRRPGRGMQKRVFPRCKGTTCAHTRARSARGLPRRTLTPGRPAEGEVRPRCLHACQWTGGVAHAAQPNVPAVTHQTVRGTGPGKPALRRPGRDWYVAVFLSGEPSGGAGGNDVGTRGTIKLPTEPSNLTLVPWGELAFPQERCTCCDATRPGRQTAASPDFTTP